MQDTNIELIAHLLRRAGFGANRDELASRAANGYEATVEELLESQGGTTDQRLLGAPLPPGILGDDGPLGPRRELAVPDGHHPRRPCRKR